MKESEKLDNHVDVTRRIIREILAEVGLSAPKFADALGIGYQRVFDLMRGRTKKFNPGIVKIICDKFPQFNPGYLSTGMGTLLQPGYEPRQMSLENEDAPDSDVQDRSDAPDTDIHTLFHRVLDMLDQINKRSAELNEFERALNEREAELNAREVDIAQREAELGMVGKKTGSA